MGGWLYWNWPLDPVGLLWLLPGPKLMVCGYSLLVFWLGMWNFCIDED